jgi:uncharacterized protein (DUF433 family)
VSPIAARSDRSAALLDRAAYTAAEAARLVGIRAGRVRRWLLGYEYTYAEAVQHQRPVLRRKATAATTYASFLDLVDLLFVKRFLDSGISLQKLRKALDEAASILGTSHFARRSFFTDGRKIFLEVREEGEAILELLSGGQWVIAPLIKELAQQIDFDSPSGLARRWYPMGPGGLIVLDPLVSFGRPTIVGRGVATANVLDFYLAEDGRVDSVSSWMGLRTEEVEAAVGFEKKLAA